MDIGTNIFVHMEMNGFYWICIHSFNDSSNLFLIFIEKFADRVYNIHRQANNINISKRTIIYGEWRII